MNREALGSLNKLHFGLLAMLYDPQHPFHEVPQVFSEADMLLSYIRVSSTS